MGAKLFSLWIVIALSAFGQQNGEWSSYGGDPGGSKYSLLKSIDRSNVKNLKVAWTYHTGDLYQPKNGRATAHETTPLFIENTLFISTPIGRVAALDPETGKERWSFDPKVDRDAGYGDFTNRGVSTWYDKDKKQRRIFVAPIDARLIALDAATGKPCVDFGKDGQIDLRVGLKNPPQSKSEYENTSPPAVIGNLVIVGSAVADNSRVEAASGEVRAFDARTGALRWTWDSIVPAKGVKTGAANAWSIISTDAQRNLVFIPTGSASPDYYGGERPGDNRYANSVVALRADTGKLVWHFQTVHHDLWDYDVASQPALYTVRQNGKDVPAVAVGSKTGHLFLLHRETGKPLFPVEERAVPKSDVPGEHASASQPFPSMPKALVPQQLTAKDAWGSTEADRKFCEERIAELRSEGIFTPPSLKGSLLFPGNVGGMAWGGAAFDPEHGLLIVPSNRLAAVVHLIPREEGKKRKAEYPAGEYAEQKGTPYWMHREFLLSPNRIPCNAPPWGTLTAIDVKTGAVRWESPLGYFPWLAKNPAALQWGSVSLGGPIVTGGGLAFIGASFDPHLRAFDVETGKELWAGDLPTSARATPMTFQAASGKQYVVISAGGHEGNALPLGDGIVAFALP
jgi:quinoprotein glucose dehydrogenase